MEHPPPDLYEAELLRAIPMLTVARCSFATEVGTLKKPAE
jgi:hypothetical protein